MVQLLLLCSILEKVDPSIVYPWALLELYRKSCTRTGVESAIAVSSIGPGSVANPKATPSPYYSKGPYNSMGDF